MKKFWIIKKTEEKEYRSTGIKTKSKYEKVVK